MLRREAWEIQKPLAAWKFMIKQNIRNTPTTQQVVYRPSIISGKHPVTPRLINSPQRSTYRCLPCRDRRHTPTMTKLFSVPPSKFLRIQVSPKRIVNSITARKAELMSSKAELMSSKAETIPSSAVLERLGHSTPPVHRTTSFIGVHDQHDPGPPTRIPTRA